VPPHGERSDEEAVGAEAGGFGALRAAAMMHGEMGSMMGWMMGLGLLGWLFVIGLLIAILVVLIRMLARLGPKDDISP
jgi:hypothetical protein